MKKPETSIELVLEWMKKASIVCDNQGRKEAAQLWRDAIEHLEYLAPLAEENRCLHALIGRYAPTTVLTEEDFAWAKKVLNI